MTKLLRLIEHSKWHYPILYGDDQYTIWRILNQLYFVLGNGYGWTNGGEIEYLFGDEDKKMTDARYAAELRLFYIHKKLSREMNRLLEIGIDPPLKFYPLSELCPIYEMPSNVTDEFLVAGWLLLKYAAGAPDEFFYDSESDGIGEGYNSTDQRNKVRELMASYLNRFGDRLEGLSWKTIFDGQEE